MKIICENLSVSYLQHTAIHHINCAIKMGTTTAIIGPNGAGKTTLVKAILGELAPNTGRVILENIKKEDMAYLPQIMSLDSSLPFTVEDVVLLGSWYHIGNFGPITSVILSRVNYCLAAVGLEGFNKRYTSELSRGQLQRVMLARVLMQSAQIIILDEPFNAMDAKTIDDILCLIKTWQNEGKTIIAVLHDLYHVEKYFEYTLLLAKELRAYDKTSAILSSRLLKESYMHNFSWST